MPINGISYYVMVTGHYRVSGVSASQTYKPSGGVNALRFKEKIRQPNLPWMNHFVQPDDDLS